MKAFSILLIRVMALFLFLRTLFSVLPALLAPDLKEIWSAEMLPALIATVVVPIAGGLVLWFAAPSLAGRIHVEADSGVNASDDELVRAGTFLIGVYLLVRHIGMLIGSYASSGAISPEPVIVIAASLAMILGAGFFGTMYAKIKYFGAEK